jgi:6-pyruvoyltetrahydropterin/6-carboxytetrahydropterin synthase
MSCSKTYPDIPFAHRQHRHQGHCARIHGHNWTLKLTFACVEYDSNGFVVDFGNLKYIKQWIADHLDHACVLAADDPLLDRIVNSVPEVYKLYEVTNASCEGLSVHLWDIFSHLVYMHEGRRVWIAQLDLAEDTHNATCFVPTPEVVGKLLDSLAARLPEPSGLATSAGAHPSPKAEIIA